MKFKIFIFIVVLNKTEAITDRSTTITLPGLLPIPNISRINHFNVKFSFERTIATTNGLRLFDEAWL